MPHPQEGLDNPSTEAAPQPSQSPPPQFITDNMLLASFLSARGFFVSVQAEGAGSRKVFFIFKPSETLTQEVSEFNEHTAVIEPQLYDSSRIKLRKLMAALQKEGAQR